MSHERSGSRRDFFLGVRNKVIDRIHIQLHEWTHSRVDPVNATHNSSVTELGEIRDFPVNKVTPLAGFRIEVVSDSAGLKARDSVSHLYFALRLAPYGKIWMDRSQNWEPNAVLCLMTGEKKIYER